MDYRKITPMKHILTTTLNLYRHNFWLFLLILAPLFLPVLGLRLIMHFTYLGKLEFIYIVLFGLIFSFISLLVEYILIYTSNQLLTDPAGLVPLKKQWAGVFKKFPPFIWLKILISVILLSIPTLLVTLAHYLVPSLQLFVGNFNIVWLGTFIVLFMFSGYALIVEGLPGTKALTRSSYLLMMNPLKLITSFIVVLVLFGLGLIILASLTTIAVALISGTYDIIASEYLTLWWETLIQQIYLILSLPLLTCLTTVLYQEARQTAETKK